MHLDFSRVLPEHLILRPGIMASPDTNDQKSDSSGSAISKEDVVEAAAKVASTVAEVLPTPPVSQLTGDLDKEEVHNTIHTEPTRSHSAAVQDHDEKGIAQEGHGFEVANLGWNKKKEKIAAPLVGGLDNEELFLLLRRFNKVRL